jgi:hypothetical protein
VPEPVFEYDDADAMGHGFVTGFVSGETMPKKIIGDPPSPARGPGWRASSANSRRG